MIELIGRKACRICERIFPDPFVFAILLTFLTMGLAFAFAHARPMDLLTSWQSSDGFWSLLKFGMQMCLILVTGHALASTPIVARGIKALARIPRTTAGAASMVALTAILCAYLNWGLGLIVGALLAREVGLEARRKGTALHYPLVVAAGYVGLMVWHGGLSGSAPLTSTSAQDLLSLLKDPKLVAGLLHRPVEQIASAKPAELAAMPGITLDQTLGAPFNIAIAIGLAVFVPLMFYVLAPKRPEDCVGVPAGVADDLPEENATGVPATLASRLDGSRILAWGTALAGFVFLVRYYGTAGLRQFNPDLMNLTLLFLGLALHGSPIAYVKAVERAAKGTAGILLQFPFYAGIMGIMQGTGLAREMAEWTNRVATPGSLPLITFFVGCVLNLFIPSGGGQWAVQGPIAMRSALELNAPVGKTLMGVAYGDELTNMLQPFWALPLLGITGLRAGEIMGYTMIVMLMSVPIYVVGLLVF